MGVSGYVQPGFETVREATTAQCSGVDAVFGEDSAWGLGFGVDADGYGMGGSGGSYAGASVVGGYAFAFITGTMGSHDRGSQVENALRGCLGVPRSPTDSGRHPGRHSSCSRP